MSLYTAWRVNGGPTQHASNQTPVTADVLEIGFIFAFAMLGFCFMLIVPGYRGISRLYFCGRVVMSLFIGSAVLRERSPYKLGDVLSGLRLVLFYTVTLAVGVLGQDWETAEIHTRTAYKAFTTHEITADVGIKIGLAAVNITLKGSPVVQSFGPLVNETINYNERYHWAWRQGRLGYGPYSGQIQQEYRASQFRGAPLPILWIAEYFTLDGELIRWGRSYRTAGWFTYIVLWTAFPTWLIANILSFVVLLYAGVMYLLTGGLMLTGIIIWSTIKWGTQPLEIPFEEATLRTHYGPNFWLVVSGGIISCLYGLTIVGMDLWAPRAIADFFEADVLQDSEQFFHKEEEEILQPADIESRQRSHQGGVQKRALRQTVIGRLARPTQRRKARPGSKGGFHYNAAFDGVTEIIPAETGEGIRGNAAAESEVLADHTENVYENVIEKPSVSTM